MLRPQVLLCLGEEKAEFDHALDGAGFGPAVESHSHRTFVAEIRSGVLCLSGGLGSAIVETSLWELLRPGKVERIVLVGTAGQLPKYTGPAGQPRLLDPVWSAVQGFHAPPDKTWSPRITSDLARAACVSTDRFYGFSTRIEHDYPAEPELLAAWQRHRDRDALVEMEAAPFYHYAALFGGDRLEYAAVKAPANEVAVLDSLPEASAAAVEAAVAVTRHLFDT